MWTDHLTALLLLQSIAVQARLPPMPKSAHFSQIACPSVFQSRNNLIGLFDRDGKSLAAITENCSLISKPCEIEGSSDLTVGPYTVVHPGAIFGPCVYKDLKIEITATDGSNNFTARQRLFATCKVGPISCDPENPIIGQFNEVIMSEFPSDFKPTSIDLREYNMNGCPADQNFGDLISNTGGCNLITNTGITNVVVVPKPDMPSTCVLTLYADTNCESPSNAKIGPITPASHPSACIGPIRNSTGDVFAAKGALLEC
ncbi:hypothetical protein B9Z19DRAFT_1133742 [Tuber borchii]|uniref:Uncharacterized protein n=1 Tax=Tuber borchii TaxID=42251 RepID=A0A2T6ZFD3_TUBBO|nr:hypothetical protein B9Z19DRAFT_1133742 [Tuber borchii]